MRGTAVLVHGMWSSPADWRWVAERLRDNDVEVVVPDLPSHRTGSAGLTADAAQVRRTIASARPPVVAVGWSYGCDASTHGVRRVRRHGPTPLPPQRGTPSP
jgi:pimeloyl-ACP methyl ester carboxylesterase